MTDQELLNLIRQYFSTGYNSGGVSALAGEGPGNAGGTGTSGQSSVGIIPGFGGGPDNREKFLQQTPGYQFAFDQGLRGIQSSAAARGTLLTGGTLRGIQRFGTGLADQVYGNTVNRYADLAKLGQQTAVAQF